MIRDATLEDIDRLMVMARKFFDATQYGNFTDYSEDVTRITIEQLINDDKAFLLVSDNGVIGGLVYPFYMSGQLTGQELFWWCEEKGEGLELLNAAEERAKEMGAESFTMLSLHGLGHDRMDKIYTNAGYTRSEHSYIRGL